MTSAIFSKLKLRGGDWGAVRTSTTNHITHYITYQSHYTLPLQILITSHQTLRQFTVTSHITQSSTNHITYSSTTTNHIAHYIFKY